MYDNVDNYTGSEMFNLLATKKKNVSKITLMPKEKGDLDMIVKARADCVKTIFQLLGYFFDHEFSN